MRKLLHLMGIVGLTLIATSTLFAKTSDKPVRPTAGARSLTSPAHGSSQHDVGNIVLSVSNNGTLGANYSSTNSDLFSNDNLKNCEYPKGSNSEYLFGAAFWIGAIVNRDTLVSTGQDGWQGGSGQEFSPTEERLPSGLPASFLRRSTLDPTKPEFRGAISEEDFIAVYNDQCTDCPNTGNDFLSGRPHTPLNIEITQKSFSWSYSYAEDIVLFDFEIKNIGFSRLRKVYMGLYVDADVGGLGAAVGGSADDLCGFLKFAPALYMPESCREVDTVNIAYIADNDGDFNEVLSPPVPDVTATRIVRTPSDSLVVSFNWWIGNTAGNLDFGPTSAFDTRDFTTGGSGTPEGDRNKYHVLKNGENDYDQAFTASIKTNEVWKLPGSQACAFSAGFDTRYLLSFGPFDIDPGGKLPVSFAYLGGLNLHTDADNVLNLACGPGYDPDAYYAGLDFTDLGDNARWASWIYDNPGVDSDGDGDFGLSRVCNTTGDTIFYQGDGVPDFRGASPPPAPIVRLVSDLGQVTIRWNGAITENTDDVFSKRIDFEGYRVYYSRDNIDFSVVSSYDLDNYNKYVFVASTNEYKLFDFPYTRDSLRCLYAPGGCGDANWDPLNYTRSSPYRLAGTDSAFYFNPQDFNQSSLTNPKGIRKRFPNAPKPEKQYLVIENIPANLRDSLLTEDKYLKYYEYEYTFTDLLASVNYFFSITTFDFGSPQTGLPPLESSVFLTSTQSYALPDALAVEENKLDAFVYPNPYRADGNYLERGYEGRDPAKASLTQDKLKEVHFANLPRVCTIRIYSIDGDLVDEIVHNESSALANHEVWDLISRNTQEVVSGLYYWVIEEPNGRTQIGKLSVIL